MAHRPATRPIRRVVLILGALAVSIGLAPDAVSVVSPRAADPTTLGVPTVAAGRAPAGVDGERRRVAERLTPPAAPSTTASQSAPAAALPEAAEPQPELDSAELTAAADRARWTYGVYGLQVAVATAGGEWVISSGVARDARTPLTPDAPSAIGSATKTFVAALVLDLAADGLLALDDQVREHLPDLPDAVVPRDVTVQHLLAHTSGLADLFYPLEPALRTEPDRQYTPAEVLEDAGPAWFTAGGGFAYSNTNYVVLGLLVEKVTGLPVGEVLEARLWEPLGLTSAELGTGIGAEGGPILQPAWATAFWTSGAITATARDLARWGSDLYGGRVLDPAGLAAMTKFTKDGYGLGVQQFVLDGEVAYGHSGLLSTYTALLVHLPAEQVTVAILANRSAVDLPAVLLHEEAGQPSLLDVALKAAPAG